MGYLFTSESVTVEYDGHRPLRVNTVVLSTQHGECDRQKQWPNLRQSPAGEPFATEGLKKHNFDS
jgi:S-adenosylmethionine synthetase